MVDALRRRNLAAAALAALALLGCTVAPPLPAAANKPKLLVFLVVDGLPQRQILAYRDQLAPDGLARFLERGAWFSDAHTRTPSPSLAPATPSCSAVPTPTATASLAMIGSIR